MLLADDFSLARFLEEVIDRNDLPCVVEWGDGFDDSAPNVYEAIGVQRPVFGTDVERARRVNDLNVRVERAVIVRQLEPAFQRQGFATPDVGEPHHRSPNARA
jgi:hypothetical protein